MRRPAPRVSRWPPLASPLPLVALLLTSLALLPRSGAGAAWGVPPPTSPPPGAVTAAGVSADDPGVDPRGAVVLLHGLARSPASMQRLAGALRGAGFTPVCNLGYPSRRHRIETLVRRFVRPALRDCLGGRSGPVHFVTHSMGGILVRELARQGESVDIGRVVMLAPPNGGSEIVDAFDGWALFRAMFGPAALQLGTGPEALVQRLGPAEFELGVVAGSRSLDPLGSAFIPGDDDGRVAVPRTRLRGMRDFVVVPASHSFIMRDPQAMRAAIRFLQDGSFSHAS